MARQRQLHGMPFQHVPQCEQLQDVRRRPVGDPGASARKVFDQALLTQQAQGLPQRDTGDAEVAGKGLFQQALARFEVAADDPGAQLVDELVDDAAG